MVTSMRTQQPHDNVKVSGAPAPICAKFINGPGRGLTEVMSYFDFLRLQAIKEEQVHLVPQSSNSELSELRWRLREKMAKATALPPPKQQPLPKPTVNVTGWCSEIEASVTSTHPAMMRYFDREVFEAIIHDHQLAVDVASLGKGIKENIAGTHPAMMCYFDRQGF